VNPFRAIWPKLRSLGRKEAVKHEIDEELRFHIGRRTAENIAAGMSAEDAAREARKCFGNVQSVREQCRDARWAGFGEATWQDVRFGARMLRNIRALGFTAAFSLLTTILFGLAPALRATRIRVTDTLKDAAHGTANGQRGGAGKLLVVAQVAVAIVLLISASLFMRSFYNLRTQDVGYNPESLVMIQLDPISAGYRGNDIGRVCETILDRIAVLPGVRSATFSENGLFSGTESSASVEMDGFTPDSEEGKFARFDQVGPGYFPNVGIPLLLGRGITERDGPAAPRVAVINETMAKFYFPGGNPIGKRLYARLQ
jgi:hypothetical protein